VPRPRESLNVVTISLIIPFQLGEGQVVSLECKQMQTTPRAGEHGYQPCLVVLGRSSDRYGVGVDPVLSMEPGALARNLRQFAPEVRHGTQIIKIAGVASDAIELYHHEAAAAVQANVLGELGVHLVEE